MPHSATILIVDDIAANRQTLCELLDTPEFQLVEAADGPTALRLAAENPPDIVLLDVMMPGMSGYEVCHHVRASTRLAEVPIIMVTALDDSESMLAGLEAGADDILTKPFNRAILRARVRTIIRLNRYRRLVDTRLALQAETVEHQETEESLRQSEEEYRVLFNSIEEGFCVIEVMFDQRSQPVNYRFLQVNPSFEKQSGLMAATGKTVLELIPKLEAQWFERMGQVALTGKSVRFVSEIKELERWLDVHAFRLGQTQSHKVAVLFNDITARRLAENTLRASEERFRAMFDLGPIAIYSCDASGTIQEYNRRAAELWGREPKLDQQQERFCGSWRLHQPDGSPISHENSPMAEVLKGRVGGAKDVEVLVERPDGLRFPAIVNIVPLKNAEGQITGAINSFYDITERKQAEADARTINTQLERKVVERTAELEAANQESLNEITDRKRIEVQLRDSLKEIGDLKSALDEHAIVAITDPKGKITYVNDKFCAISKYSRRELIGQDHRIINSGHHPKEFIRDLWVTIAQGKVWKGEIKNEAKDGSYYWVGTTIVPFLDKEGKPRHYVAIRADITERKRFERALQESNIKLEVARLAAEQANLAKSDFLSSMSHELRSPLNAILGFAQLLEAATPPPTGTQKPRIALILQAGWYLLKLIDEILDLASIESGKVSLSPEPVLLSELLSVCQDMMESQAQLRGIRMTFPQLDNTMYVHADRTRLQQIVINLLSNAIKYNKQQGTVMVDCTLSSPGRVRLSFRDTGAGLPPEKLAQLFQPFNRLGQETGGVAGTGIGLVVTKRLVEKMNGAIGVESAPGAGSVFWCEFNSIAAPQLEVKNGKSAPNRHLPVAVDGPKRTLLYVEDNPANMELVEQIVADYPDLRLLTAVTGTLGIEIARAEMPQVILMDINLPGISGIKALKILREDPATAHIPVVALSANAMPRDIEKGLEAGFFCYLTKPIRVKEFMDTMNRALEFATTVRSGAPGGEPIA
jgi:PAS domain S-box-containing protein